MPIKTFVHLNHHLMCSIDVETTGLQAGYNEIIQIAIIPIDNKFEPFPGKNIFECLIQPIYPERVDRGIPSKEIFQRAMLEGYEPSVAAELFESWFMSLELPERKRIIPLGFNYAGFDKEFISKWLGPVTYSSYFDSRIRDLFVVVNYLNDRADSSGEKYPFPKEDLKLKTVCKQLGVPVVDGSLHDSLYDASLVPQAYKKVLKELFI